MTDAASEDLPDAWKAADRHFESLGHPTATFMRDLLAQLRSRWAGSVRPDFSMTTLLFTRPGETGYRFSERVEVVLEVADRARMALVREVPRSGLDRVGGLQTVAGDVTRPENAAPALEARRSMSPRRSYQPVVPTTIGQAA